MTNFNERTKTLLYKDIPLTIYSKGLMLVVCERWVEDGDRHIDPKFFSRPQQHFFLILAGLLNRGSLRAQALFLELVLTSQASYLQLRLELNWLLKPSMAPGYAIVWHPPPSCGRTLLHRIQPRPQVKVIFRCLQPDAPFSLLFGLFIQVHRFIDGSVEGQYVTEVFFCGAPQLFHYVFLDSLNTLRTRLFGRIPELTKKKKIKSNWSR